jgi:hypothetical protein
LVYKNEQNEAEVGFMKQSFVISKGLSAFGSIAQPKDHSNSYPSGLFGRMIKKFTKNS